MAHEQWQICLAYEVFVSALCERHFKNRNFWQADSCLPAYARAKVNQAGRKQFNTTLSICSNNH
jgi:hypothetical protein